MTIKIELPGDRVAEMATVEDVTGEEIERAVALLDMDGVDIEGVMKSGAGEAGMIKAIMRIAPQLNRALAAVMLRSWSAPDGGAIPDFADLGKLPLGVLKPLYAVAGDARPLLLESFGFGPAATPDPKPAPAS